MLLDDVEKLPLPVMFADVGAWPISSAAAGVAATTAPTDSAASALTVARIRPVRVRRRFSRRGGAASGRSSGTVVLLCGMRDHALGQDIRRGRWRWPECAHR